MVWHPSGYGAMCGVVYVRRDCLVYEQGGTGVLLYEGSDVRTVNGFVCFTSAEIVVVWNTHRSSLKYRPPKKLGADDYNWCLITGI